MARNITTIVETLNIDRVLGDMDRFMRAYPSNTWKERPSDSPLRTIKTILHAIIRLKGKSVSIICLILYQHKCLISNSKYSVKLKLLESLKS